MFDNKTILVPTLTLRIFLSKFKPYIYILIGLLSDYICYVNANKLEYTLDDGE